MNVMADVWQGIENVREATLEARRRCGDTRIGTCCAGPRKLAVVLVDYMPGGGSTVTKVTGPMSIDETVDFLRKMTRDEKGGTR